jgi:hypothetical protein
MPTPRVRAEMTMNFNGEANNPFGQRIVLVGHNHVTVPSLPHRLTVEKL